MNLLIKLANSISVGYGLAGLAFLILVMRLGYPHHRGMAAFVYLLSWVPFVLSYYHKRALFAREELVVKGFLLDYWPHLFLLFGLLSFLYILFVVLPFSFPLSNLNDEDLSDQIRGDTEALLYLDHEMDTLLSEMVEEGLFEKEGKALLADSSKIRDRWANFVSDAIELDLIKNKYKGFSHINPAKRASLHADSFLLAYGAFMTQYHYGLLLSQHAQNNTALITMLNESPNGHTIPEESFDALVFNVTAPNSFVRLNAGRLYRPFMKSYSSEAKALNALIDRGLNTVDDSLMDYPELLAKNPLRFLENRAFKLWFPVQKHAALGTSYIRFSTRDYLIKPELLQHYREQFLPGDIFLERREWHATNAGIPGYWTHAALYLGTLEEMDAYFNELPELGSQSFSNYLKNKLPHAYEAFSSLHDDGFPFRIIESKRPGVILNSLEDSGGGDALGVLRAKKVTQTDRLNIVMAALVHLGKGYDYNFDFTTDNELVCSELIYKAYQNIPNIDLELQDFNGRLILSPNSLVEKFEMENGSPEAQLEMVLFLDGNEKTEKVLERDTEAFKSSWKRPKWHIVKDHL